MSINKYYDKLVRFREALTLLVTELFDTYGNKLELELGGCNLLRRQGNCIESSTAVGYLLEEFLVSKLEESSKEGKCNGFTIESYTDGTSTRSSDCFSTFENLKILINVKVEKEGNSNNAVAAISQLAKDYSSEEGPLAFLVLKVPYGLVGDGVDRRVWIKDRPVLRFLEEYDFSHGHEQDHRQWSDRPNKAQRRGNNGRLVLSPSFVNEHNMPVPSISSELTKRQLLLLNTEVGRQNDYIMPEDVWPQRR